VVGAEQAPAPAAEAPGSEPAKNASPGRIFVEVFLPPSLPNNPANDDRGSKILAINPETGKWTKVVDNGGFLRVSPDGRAIVFRRDDSEIWRCDAQGKEKPVRLADKAGQALWAPDGKQLVHSRGERAADHGWRTETWRLNADGTGATKLPVPDTDFIEDWSPDGKWFVTLSDRHPPRGRGYQLYLMHPDGTEERRLTNGGGLNCYARFSPDGRRLVYIHQLRGSNSLHILDLAGGEDREILNEKDGDMPDAACWSPDGKRLAVGLTTRPRPGATDLPDNPLHLAYRLEIMGADGGNRRELKLTDAEGNPIRLSVIGHPDWR
jgi:Tol biopolymer transport system component